MYFVSDLIHVHTFPFCLYIAYLPYLLGHTLSVMNVDLSKVLTIANCRFYIRTLFFSELKLDIVFVHAFNDSVILSNHSDLAFVLLP